MIGGVPPRHLSSGPETDRPVTRRRPIIRNESLSSTSLQSDDLDADESQNFSSAALEEQEEEEDKRAEIHPLMSSSVIWRLFGAFALFRMHNALLVKTFFDPDEYWQSLEVAHEFVFGYGHLTWEWTHRIRGFAHPLVFASVYKILKVLGIDQVGQLVVVAPRMLQGILAAVCDCHAFMLALRVYGPETARWTVVTMSLSWFNFFCLVRTYSNSLEATLTVVALCYWPLPRAAADGKHTRRDFRISLVFAALACVIRPTNAILWLYLGFSLLMRCRNLFNQVAIIHDVLVTGLLAVCLSMAIDYQMYGEWTFVPLQFVKFNVLQNISLFYGGHAFHWYFTQGLPVVLLTMLPLTIWGWICTKEQQKRHLFSMCVWTVMVLSIQSHKEFRFLMPLVPVLLIYAGHGLANIEKSDKEARRTQWRSYTWRIVATVLATNAIASFYLSRVHQSGVVGVVEWLRKETSVGRVQDVLFLMPCHSTPFYSHVHHNVPMRFISCEPPLDIKNRKTYHDETDLLYSNATQFVELYFDKQVGNKTIGGPVDDVSQFVSVSGQSYQIRRYQWASHIVMFDNPKLFPVIKTILDGSDYHECCRFFNSHFHDDSKRRGDVVVYCKLLG